MTMRQDNDDSGFLDFGGVKLSTNHCVNKPSFFAYGKFFPQTAMTCIRSLPFVVFAEGDSLSI
jgi:hypothetical protein